MERQIYLDISRLLSAAWRATPSGIERVELVYANQFLGEAHTDFVASLLGRLHRVPRRFALGFCKALEKSWGTNRRFGRAKAICYMVLIDILLLALVLSSFLHERGRSKDKGSVYINLSHENLSDRAAITRFKSLTNARMLFFVHDLIPITHPEYVRPGQAAVHARRIETVADLADAVIVNTVSTKNEFLYHLRFKTTTPMVRVIHLGVMSEAALPSHLPPDGIEHPPYFVCLATIEPRKNHLLLLHLWRSFLADNLVPPGLVIVGRRGWENEMVLDMLDRCPSLLGFVEERRGVNDQELRVLLRGARALLLPSFVEGYGLPVPEALSLGTPIICSDLSALREVGGDVPEYLDPLDGPAWRQAILDYSTAGSPRRAAQCARLPAWSVPSWQAHFHQVREIINSLDVASSDQA